MLALLAIGTKINYLDRTVLGIAAPSLTREPGLSAAVMGVVFSAFSWTYCRGTDSRWGFSRPFRGTPDLFSVGRSVVGVHAAAGLRDRALLAARVSVRARRFRSTLLSDQQPGRDHVVPAIGARPRHRHLHGRRVSRARVLQPAAVLAAGQLRLAFAVSGHGRCRARVRGGVVDQLSRSARERRR